jgi:MoxR-like ATPase
VSSVHPAAGASSESAATAGRSEIDAVRRAVRSVVHGKDSVVELALTAVLAGGHVLLEDVPGVGKTTLAHSLASALGGTFSRIQFTSDLLPGDITGTNVLDPQPGQAHRMSFRAGPLFANVVLADEINRTTPRTQSALFEAMEEGQVTVDGVCRSLPRPFLVIATQNPFDHHGTYALPDSQLDRFLLRLSMGYPDREAERAVLRQADRPKVEPVIDPAGVQKLRADARAVRVAEPVEDYLLDLVRRTRSDSRLVRGVSTRGAKALYRAARAHALLEGRSYVVPEDVRRLAPHVLSHRVMARQRDGEVDAIVRLLDEVPLP